MIIDFHHASFTVHDMERSLAFYRDVLGMTVLNEREIVGDYLTKILGYPELHMKIVFLLGGGEKLELIQYLSPAGAPVDAASYNPGTAHLAFVVDDIHAAYERLQAHGVKTRSEPVPIPKGPHKGGYSMYVYDPDGISIELMQLAPQA